MAVLAEVSPSAVGGGMAVPDDMASMAARTFIRLDIEQRPYSQELLLPFPLSVPSPNTWGMQKPYVTPGISGAVPDGSR